MAILNYCFGLTKTIKLAMRRDLRSEEHKRAWAKFDRLLNYRANFAFFTKLIYMVGWTALGKANYQESQTFRENEVSKYNREISEDVFELVKWILIVMGITRLLLMLVSIK